MTTQEIPLNKKEEIAEELWRRFFHTMKKGVRVERNEIFFAQEWLEWFAYFGHDCITFKYTLAGFIGKPRNACTGTGYCTLLYRDENGSMTPGDMIRNTFIYFNDVDEG